MPGTCRRLVKPHRPVGAAIMKPLTVEVLDTIDISEENVWVYNSDIPPTGVTECGAVFPQSGQGAACLAALPQKLWEACCEALTVPEASLLSQMFSWV